MKQHCIITYLCADEPGSPSVLTLAAGVAVSAIVLVIAVVNIAAIVICWR